MQTTVADVWGNFTRALQTEETYRGYTRDVKAYMKYHKLVKPEELIYDIKTDDANGTQTLTTISTTELEDKAITFIMWAKNEDKKSVSRIRRMTAAIKLFYEVNRIMLNWKFINRHIGKGKARKKDSAYNHIQIQKCLNVASPRNKVIIYLLASSGVRRGALPTLRKRNLEPIDKYGIFKITVYEGEDEEYRTYCSSECRKAIEEYFEYRIRCGEPMSEDSLVIRNEFDRDDIPHVKSPRAIIADTISQNLIEIVEKAGIRIPVTLTADMKLGSFRHPVKAVHGFRKFWDTQMTIAGISPLYSELLEGHTIKGMKHHYLRPTDEELLEGNGDRMRGYADALDYVTINEENRLKRENVQLKQQNAVQNSTMHDMQAAMKVIEERLQRGGF